MRLNCRVPLPDHLATDASNKSGNFSRVSQLTLTRTIKVRLDFDKRGCSVYGLHRDRVRATFYTKVAECLATYARANYDQDDVRFLELAL